MGDSESGSCSSDCAAMDSYSHASSALVSAYAAERDLMAATQRAHSGSGVYSPGSDQDYTSTMQRLSTAKPLDFQLSYSDMSLTDGSYSQAPEDPRISIDSNLASCTSTSVSSVEYRE